MLTLAGGRLFDMMLNEGPKSARPRGRFDLTEVSVKLGVLEVKIAHLMR